MKSERWKQVDELLSSVLKLDSDKRAAFLDEACAGDEALRKEIETLLASDKKAHSSFIESPASQLAAKLVTNHKDRLSSGDSIGSYKILSMLGAGGMGEVYRARDARLERDVAIKVLPEHLADPQSLSRFEREVKALAALSHSNILTIHEFGIDHGIPYAVMELLKGQTLREKLNASKLSTSEALGAAISIADGMAAAHSAGVIHRDLKPENIFLTSDGGVKILDFGLARREMPSSTPEQTSAETVSRTATGLVMGTIPYMSPEQVRGDPVDARTDIFSFGSVLYEMLAGTRAFARRTQAETIAAILNESPAPLSDVERKIPPELNQVVQHCLEKHPDRRFQTARDLAFALRSASTSAVETLREQPQQIPRRRPFFLAMVAFLILIAIASSLYLLKGRSRPIHSLAILPFANVSHDSNTEYLSDGITESIINSLSSVPQLKVMARDTVFSYKEKHIDPRKVGHDLSVAAVVTGRVFQQGDTLVVRVDLVDASDGTQLWGEQYNQKLANLLEVQEEISRKISEKLQLKLTGKEQESVVKRYTENTEAYQLYLKGHYHFYKFTSEDYQKSIQYYQQAIEKDPNYALAYIGLSQSYFATGVEGFLPPSEACSQTRANITRAMDLDDTIPKIHFVLAIIAIGCDWDYPTGLKEYRRAIELNPDDPEFRRFYSSNLRQLGRFEEAVAEAKKAQELDPLSLDTNKNLGVIYYWASKYDQAIEQYRKTLELDPNNAIVHDYLADAYARKGMYKEAAAEEQKYLILAGNEEGATAFRRDCDALGYHEAMRKQYQDYLEYLKQSSLEGYVAPYQFALLYALLNDKDQAFTWLEKAYAEHSPSLAYIKEDPQLDNLRSDPRFLDLLRRIGLPS